MTISAAKVRLVCTSSEADLVRASRKPALAELSYAEVKRLAARARKLSVKWQDLGQGQARARSRQAGLGTVDSNTALKAEIFREALTSLEARLAKLEAAADTATKKKAKPTTKRDRNVEHRATRSAVRKGMTAVEDLLNTRKKKK